VNKILTEENRRRIALFLAHMGWWGAIVLTTVLTWYNTSRPPTALPTTFQRVAGIFIILMMGVGIAACSALSRMRLSRTIVAAFEQGYKLTQSRHPELAALHGDKGDKGDKGDIGPKGDKGDKGDHA
jgi:hypothetical protein